MLDIVGSIFGIIASILFCLKFEINKKELYIFICFLFADIFFIIYAISVNSIGIFIANICYLLTSIKGIIKNIKNIKKK